MEHARAVRSRRFGLVALLCVAAVTHSFHHLAFCGPHVQKQLASPLLRHAVPDEIDTMISSNKVLVVSKARCPFCQMAKAELDKLGAKYEVLELEDMDRKPLVDNPAAIQDYMEAKTGARSVPRVFVGGEFIGGGTDVAAKAKSGELAKLLEGAGVEMTPPS